MPVNTKQEYEYDDQFVERLALIWGEGFLSPGGAEEVRALLEGSDLRGLEVLDIGCGPGGADMLLVEEHGAKRVVGIDLEPPLVDRAIKLGQKKGLSASLEFIIVEPGPLPFAEASFDVVFSKETMLSIPDKAALYADVFRVLRPGGSLIASDWLKAEGQHLDGLQEYLDAIDFSANMETQATTTQLLKSAGFIDVKVRDRTQWLKKLTKRDNDHISGSLKEQAMEILGSEKYDDWMRIRRGLIVALDTEELQPSHLLAKKPHH